MTRMKNNREQETAAEAFEKKIESKLVIMEEKFAASFKALAKSDSKQPITLVDKETRMQRELLLGAGTMVIRDLEERGLPFAYEAEVLSIIAQGNESAEKYIGVIQKYAASGIKGKKMLISEFNSLYPHLSSKNADEALPEEIKEENKEELPWWKNVGTSILQWTKNLFASRKTRELPVLEAESDKVFELVNEGDLATALNELNTDDTYSQLMNDSLRQWTYQVRLYLDFDKAVSGLLMNALANLHLKEMEH